MNVHRHQRLSPYEARQIADASEEAAAIGGYVAHRGQDPAQWPLEEAGEGVSEGFELAEQALIDAAQHTDSPRGPLVDALAPEGAGAAALVGDFGEADQEQSSELPGSDR